MAKKSQPKAKRGLSVLMAVYKNDRAEWIRQAIESILDQTHKADEFIVVVDGPIGDDLSSVLDEYAGEVSRIQLERNKGLWNALNVGLQAASYELVARMDSDDIALSDRFEKQIKEFLEDKDLDLIGGQVAEFNDHPDEIISYRRVPESPDEIRNFAKLRSPFNHPTVMFRRDKVLEVGGYHELYRTEDYDLWVRMIQAGMNMRNLPDILLSYRVGRLNAGRKASSVQHGESVSLQARLRKAGFISWPEYVAARAARAVFYYLPSHVKFLVYRKILRSDEVVSDK